MEYENKTKEQLINELVELHQRVAELEASETERKKQIEVTLQESEEIRRIEKLEAIGVLAGGISHDFNNLLMGITGYIALARLFSNKEKVIECLTEAEEVAFQAKDLILQLLTFSKGEALVKETASISELLKATTQFALRGSNVKCEFSIVDNLWAIKIDKGQFSQSVSNLVIYIDHAMPEGGIISVEAQNVVSSKKDDLPLKAGEYIRISVKAESVVIPETHLSKLFDPYFTTKGTGSGLGLAICLSIIKNYNGHITVNSEESIGTVFHIYLPTQEQIPAEKEAESQVVVSEEAVSGEGKILLMDDEEVVRKVATQLLKYIGYEVEIAKDGSEAIKLYQEAKDSGQPFSAVILDFTVPGGMGGKEAIEKFLEMDPEVKAIVSSGYSTDPMMSDYKRYGFSGAIAKPYKIKKLSKILNEMMRET